MSNLRLSITRINHLGSWSWQCGEARGKRQEGKGNVEEQNARLPPVLAWQVPLQVKSSRPASRGWQTGCLVNQVFLFLAGSALAFFAFTSQTNTAESQQPFAVPSYPVSLTLRSPPSLLHYLVFETCDPLSLLPHCTIITTITFSHTYLGTPNQAQFLSAEPLA